MNPRQARRERREAERKAKKLELKRNQQAPQEVHSLPKQAEPIGFVSQPAPSRAEINRANAQFSTGPRSSDGKLASSRNSLKHGLASGQLIIPGEDPAEFQALLNDLLSEHQPATATEELLVQEMAQSHWLRQRAVRLQNTCFTHKGVNEKQLALFLRYQTTHDRNFHKALATLLKLKKLGFVSQSRNSSIGFVSQRPGEFGFVSQNEPEVMSTGDLPPQKQAA